MKPLALGLFLAASTALNAQQLAPNAPKDKPVTVEEKAMDKLIAPHVAKARETYPDASKRFRAGLPKDHHFFVTTRIKDPDGTFEQVFIYVSAIDPEKKTITGKVSNDLGRVKTFKKGQTVTFPESEMLDWTISKPDGSEEGNFIGKFLDEYQKEKH